MRTLRYSISNYKIQGWIEIDHRECIAKASPVFKWAIGLYANKLLYWMKKMGETRVRFVNNTQLEFNFV